MGTSAGIWGFISLLVALFVGGWVTTQRRSLWVKVGGALVGPIELTVRRENRRSRDPNTTIRDQNTPQI